jgi:hypothetical protein
VWAVVLSFSSIYEMIHSSPACSREKNNRVNDYCRNQSTIGELVEPKSSKCNNMCPIWKDGYLNTKMVPDLLLQICESS